MLERRCCLRLSPGLQEGDRLLLRAYHGVGACLGYQEGPYELGETVSRLIRAQTVIFPFYNPTSAGRNYGSNQ